MQKIWKDILLSAFLGLVMPTLILGVLLQLRDQDDNEPTAAQTQPVTEAGGEQEELYIRVVLGEETTQMLLEEYLVGVLLAEMPADFEEEALKAQAVVARTYALRRHESGNKHEQGGVCGESTCCQGYKSPEDYVKNGGTKASVDKIRRAVQQTHGEVLTYEGDLIEGTYFSTSGGMTEDALEVWGVDIPYLKATESPGEEHASHDTDTALFTREEFLACIDTELTGDPEDWIGQVTYTAGGGVQTIQIGSRNYTGTELRSLLGLPSTNFTMTPANNGIFVVTHGYGHRVGMSQYGADAMAASGVDYRQILAHYYSGTTLEQYISANQ